MLRNIPDFHTGKAKYQDQDGMEPRVFCLTSQASVADELEFPSVPGVEGKIAKLLQIFPSAILLSISEVSSSVNLPRVVSEQVASSTPLQKFDAIAWLQGENGMFL